MKVSVYYVKVNKFEEEGVRRQREASNIWQAYRQFENSCKLCTERGRQSDCETCPIKEAYDNNVNYIFFEEAERIRRCVSRKVG